MGFVGVPELILLVTLLFPLLAFVPVYLMLSKRRAARLGYPSVKAYLLAVPQSDDQRRDAADLALKGLAICILGLIFAPLVFVGLVPLFYGGRKIAHALMGLGFAEEGQESRDLR